MYLHRMLGGSQIHGNEDRALAKGAWKTWQLASADRGVLVLVEIEMQLLHDLAGDGRHTPPRRWRQVG